MIWFKELPINADFPYFKSCVFAVLSYICLCTLAKPIILHQSTQSHLLWWGCIRFFYLQKHVFRTVLPIFINCCYIYFPHSHRCIGWKSVRIFIISHYIADVRPFCHTVLQNEIIDSIEHRNINMVDVLNVLEIQHFNLEIGSFSGFKCIFLPAIIGNNVCPMYLGDGRIVSYSYIMQRW